MTTYTIGAGHVSRPRFVHAGKILSVTPGAGGTAKIEYTTGTAADVQNGSAVWAPWILGDCPNFAMDMAGKDCYIRVTATGAAVSYSIEENTVESQIAAFAYDWATERNERAQIRVVGGDQVGNELTASFPNGTGTVQWARITPGTGAQVDIAGATNLKYTRQVADIGFIIAPYATSYIPMGKGRVTRPGYPSAPQNVSASAGNNSATVSGNAPASNGGSAVTGYRITRVPAFPGSGEVNVQTLPYTDTTALNGTTYTYYLQANNIAGPSPVAASNSVTPGPIAARMASASKRLYVPIGSGAAGANNVRTSRIGERPNATVTSPIIDVAPTTWVDEGQPSTAPHEIVTSGACPIRAAIITNVALDVDGVPLRAQPGSSVLTQATFFNFANGVAGYAFKLDGTPGTAAEFTAAGGTISGDGFTLNPPIGWFGSSDPMSGVTLTKGQIYLLQYEVAPAQGVTYVSGSCPAKHPELGDLAKDAAGTGTAVFLKDWTTLSGVTTTVTVAPVGVHGMSATGAATIAIPGDSVDRENADRKDSYAGALFGDADGAMTIAGRALNTAGYCSVRTAVSGSTVSNPVLYNGYNLRKFMIRHCQGALFAIGKNDRGLDWATILPRLRTFWNLIRAACAGGNGRIVAMDWPPQASSTDQWLTTANQTSSTGPGSMQYDSYNPFIAAGVFNTGLGDPNAGYQAFKAMYDLAAANGATDVDAQRIKWPCDGVNIRAWCFDQTHPTEKPFKYVAADLAPKLPTLLGFGPSN